MLELHLPWLELAILTPLVGVVVSLFNKNAEQTRLVAIVFSGLSLAMGIGAWEDFNTLKVFEAHDRWDLVEPLFGPDVVVIDEFNAPLLALTSLMFFLTPLATLRTKIKRFPFRMNLISQFLMLSTLACRGPWIIISLMGLQTLPIVWELRTRGKSSRGFVIHMGLFLVLLIGGWSMIDLEDPSHEHSIAAIMLLTLAILIRSGCAPMHCWMTDLFEKASLGSSLLFVSPMIGAYAAVRLLLPVAPDWAMRIVALASLFTAVYSAGMALVQTESRRFFCYLILSNASLVLVGLEVVTPIGLTGALSTWIAVCLSLSGFGLTLRAIESRVGRLSLNDYHGLYSQMPLLATFFLLTGVATVGFPGTVGFAGIELIVEGAVEVYPYVGMAVVIATALNGIAIMRVYFRLFTGTIYQSSFCMEARWPERVGILVLSALIIGGGIWPQPGVKSRFHAAKEIMSRRETHTQAETDKHATLSAIPDDDMIAPTKREQASHTLTVE
ncbi:proton-conducting transporter transmembrane domain-containing protein [Mariniblastus fucicola]|uniref:NADH-quinone oxidoreductase subunit M n=1 Tax=Mariniblastus fucicola TaxID=980251 RepID=A0A5B9P8V3_9BACT|nr:proton-conducting transporter membrane subunit [Mariniblastus fucicola]QEG21056.1 NADH-quinone oxidoreductase subunit M [Mariniblastus fucicola]